MGVSGLLISCATRRATSLHAAAFCARSRSLVSSMTTTKPALRRAPSMAAHGDRPDAASFARRLHFQLLGRSPVRRARFIR